MSKVAVVYWSSTGNTEAMANAVADGIREKGGEAVLHTCEDFDGSKVAEYDAIAFGCPAMGDEVLEDTEFEPMFDGCKDALKGKNIIFCSQQITLYSCFFQLNRRHDNILSLNALKVCTFMLSLHGI